MSSVSSFLVIVILLIKSATCWEPWYHVSLAVKKEQPLDFYSCRAEKNVLFSVQKPTMGNSKSFGIFLNILANQKFPSEISTTFIDVDGCGSFTVKFVFESRKVIREYNLQNGKEVKNQLCDVITGFVNFTVGVPQIEYGDWEWDTASIYGLVDHGILQNTTHILVKRDGRLILSMDYKHDVINSDECRFFHLERVIQFENLGKTHWTIALVVTILTLITMILLLLFKNQQPLASRGAIPFSIACITLLLNLLSLLTHYYSNDLAYHSRISKSLELFAGHLDNSTGLILPLIVFNYIFIINIHTAKRIAYRDKNMDQFRASWYFRFVILSKYLKTWICTGGVALFCIGTQTVLFMLNLLFDDKKLMAYISNAIPLSLFCLLLIVDLLLSKDDLVDSIRSFWKCNLRKSWTSYYAYLKKDLYWVRIELGFILCVGAVYFVNEGTEDPQLRTYVLRSIITAYHFTIMLSSLIPTIILSIRNIFRKKRAINEKLDLKSSLRNSTQRLLIKEATFKESSYENLLCWEYIQKYKKEKKNRRKLADIIFVNFLSGAASPNEVNISAKMSNDVKASMKTEERPDDLFKVVESEVLVCLYDTFFRLVHSKEFKKKLEIFERKKELLGSNSIRVFNGFALKNSSSESLKGTKRSFLQNSSSENIFKGNRSFKKSQKEPAPKSILGDLKMSNSTDSLVVRKEKRKRNFVDLSDLSEDDKPVKEQKPDVELNNVIIPKTESNPSNDPVEEEAKPKVEKKSRFMDITERESELDENNEKEEGKDKKKI